MIDTRTQYFVKNVTADRTISIGDLHQIPSILAGKQYDILKFASRETVLQSEDLRTGIRRGWLKVFIYNNDVLAETVDENNVDTVFVF
jgi:hypothetical protein